MKLRHILGVSAGFHDAALSVVRSDGRILFAAHSERYSGVKNDACIHPELLKEALDYGIDAVAYYERPWMHNIQQLVSGQHAWAPWTTKGALDRYIGRSWRTTAQVRSWPHHLSHAAAGFQTSPFDSAAVVVIDAIGELDTISIYRASYNSRAQAQYQRVWRQRYPHSIGLFYSAITQEVGLRPMEEEYITMGMAAYGDSSGADWMREQFVRDHQNVTFRQNLHAGFAPYEMLFTHNEDIAASAQAVTEGLIRTVMQRAKSLTGSTNLVYMGGVALNCVANSRLTDIFDNVWIMPNPGDAGSSLGAAALSLGTRLLWDSAYLGHDIPGAYPVDAIVRELEQNKICGVASGRAEWGPRALGNRSLLADPRGPNIKDQVNAIKQRQKFRPFAPAILEELVDTYFAMPTGWRDSRYMQCVARCLDPDLFPAIVHHDGSSRVQTVPPDGSGFRCLLEAWYAKTGCPMLLNTSLNIRGEPMVNNRADADRFEKAYGVRVCS